MKELVPQVPDGRCKQLPDGAWEARWTSYGPSWMTLQPVFLLVPLMGLDGFLGLPVMAGILALFEVHFSWLPVRRARWDAEGLQLGDGEVWAWEDIEDLGIDGQRLRLVVRGKEHVLLGPKAEEQRDALLARWTAHRSRQPPRLASETVPWRTDFDRQLVTPRFRARGAPQRARPSALRPAIWAWFLLLSAHGMLRVAGPLLPFEPGLVLILLFFGVFLASFVLPFVMAVMLTIPTLRRGEVAVDQHTLTLTPVDRAPFRFAWDAIERLEHDDLELRITTAEGTFPFDFSSEPPASVRGLVQSLEDRWHARTTAASPAADAGALDRLRQAARTER